MSDIKNSWIVISEDVFSLLARLVLGIMFLYSGIPKIDDPIGFIIKVDEYNVLPPGLVEPFATIAPWVMVIAGGMLVLGLLTRVSGGMLALMLVSFLIAVGINIYRETTGLDCGCFGEGGHTVGWQLFLEDVESLLLTSYLIIRGGRRISLDHPLRRLIFKKD